MCSDLNGIAEGELPLGDSSIFFVHTHVWLNLYRNIMLCLCIWWAEVADTWMLNGLGPANMPGIHFSCSVFSGGSLELAKWMCNLWVGMLMSWVSLPSWTTAFDGLVSASCEACSGQGKTEWDPCTATASLPQELPALPMTFMFKDRELEPRQNIRADPLSSGFSTLLSSLLLKLLGQSIPATA